MRSIEMPARLNVVEVPGDIDANGKMDANAVAHRYSRSVPQIRIWSHAGLMPPAGDDGRWSVHGLRAWEQMTAGVIGQPQDDELPIGPRLDVST